MNLAMSQLTKILLFTAFISSCWAIDGDFVTPAFYGVPGLFLVWGLVTTLRARKRERDIFLKNAPDPDSIRRYYRTGYTCAEEFATFEGFVESAPEKGRSPRSGKRG